MKQGANMGRSTERMEKGVKNLRNAGESRMRAILPAGDVFGVLQGKQFICVKNKVNKSMKG